MPPPRAPAPDRPPARGAARAVGFGLSALLGLGAAPVAALAVALGLGVGLLREGPGPLIAGLTALGLLGPPALAAPLGGAAGRGPRFFAALGLWSALIVYAFPLYFPLERAGALSAGGAVLARALGVALPPALPDTLDARLPGISGRLPAPVALPAPAPPARTGPVVSEDGELVVLPYEGSASSLRVPVELEGRGGRHLEVVLLFDTGASFTSVDRRTLDALGVRVPDDAPTIEVRTANGPRQTPLVLIERLWIGGFEVEGVTVGLCDACAHEDEVGLLGLNVSGRFLVTVDQQAREIHLRPRPDAHQGADVRYWVHPAAAATRWPDGRVDVEVSLRNDAPRVVRDAVVRVGCGEDYEVAFARVAPGETAVERAQLPRGASCDSYTVAFDRGRW